MNNIARKDLPALHGSCFSCMTDGMGATGGMLRSECAFKISHGVAKS